MSYYNDSYMAPPPFTGTGIISIANVDGTIGVGNVAGAVTLTGVGIDTIAGAHPVSAAWSNNSKKITNLANGSSAQDAAAFGQIPTALPPNGAAGGDLSGTYPNPTVAKLNGVVDSSYVTLTGTQTLTNKRVTRRVVTTNIQNGDVIRRINGYDLNSPEKALEIYSKLKEASRIDIEIERNGSVMRKTYNVR